MPPTPVNVRLLTKKSRNQNPEPSLLVSWDVPHSSGSFVYRIGFFSNSSSVFCSATLLEEILSYITIEHQASAPHCPLNASTLYYATVQILSVGANNQSYDEGNNSLPSNFHVTGMKLFEQELIRVIQKQLKFISVESFF